MIQGKGRMRITVESSGWVVITYWDDIEGAMVERVFSAPTRHGYVIEHMRGWRTGQVCEQLASTGTTLMASSDTLSRVIRREYQAMRRAEKRYLRAQ